jgi:hypothetical protein
MSPLKVIRQKCLDCCGDQPSEVRNCQSEGTCALWPYRMGTRPEGKKRVLSESHRQALAAGRLKAIANRVDA